MFLIKYRQHLIALGIIFAIGLLSYFDSLRSPFMIDDHGFFDERIKNIRFLPSEFAPDQNHFLGVQDALVYLYYRPLAHILPMINYWIFGDNVMGHHAVNLLLFCLAAFMLYLLIYKVFNDWKLALLAAVFYLVHPINGVVVNYITANVFAAEVIFIVASLFFVIGKTDRVIANSILHVIASAAKQSLSVFFFLLALLCHESAMGLPLYAMALLIFGLGLSFKQTIQKTWSLWLVLVLYLIFRWHHASINAGLLQKYSQFHMNVFEFIASLVKLVWWYLLKLVYPVGIVLIAIMPVVRQWVIGWWLLLGVSVGLFIFLMKYFRQDRVIRLGLVWLVIGFLPMAAGCLFQPIHGLMIEPHWFIFSSSGFFLILARIVFIGAKPRICGSIALVVLVLWFGLTHIYNRLWSDEKRYCLYWLNEEPDFAAVMFYLGQAFTNDKNYPEAKYYYLQALSRDYAPWMVYVNLGNMDLLQGKNQEAEKYFHMASRQVPLSPVVLTNEGMLLFKQDKYQEAQKFFEEAIKVDVLFVPARVQLAKVYEDEGKMDEAEKSYRDALSIAPHDESAEVPLIKIYYDRKDEQDLIALCRDLFAHSRSAQTLTNVGILLGFYGFPNEALGSFERSIFIDSSYSDAYFQEGLVLLKLNHNDKALEIWQRGLKIAPQDARLEQGVKELNAKMGDPL